MESLPGVGCTLPPWSPGMRSAGRGLPATRQAHKQFYHGGMLSGSLPATVFPPDNNVLLGV